MKKKKDVLVPFEKSERVIHLDKRGKEKGGLSAGTVIFGILGLLCILYCVAIACAGFGTYFFLIWGAVGAVFLLLGLFCDRRLSARVPRWIRNTVKVLFCLGGLLFCIVEGLILTQYHAMARPGADYCIILGAQWKSNGPSEVLRRRLNKAVEYLNENPNTLVIVSGGQGGNEVISEAVGMKQYLMAAGISEERILVEDKSTNTRENLAFSAELLDKDNSQVVIVTNNFHMFRALKIAEKQGYQAEGLSADSVAWMVPNNLLREFMGVCKDFLVGNL